jgi:hypothetical protein
MKPMGVSLICDQPDSTGFMVEDTATTAVRQQSDSNEWNRAMKNVGGLNFRGPFSSFRQN